MPCAGGTRRQRCQRWVALLTAAAAPLAGAAEREPLSVSSDLHIWTVAEEPATPPSAPRRVGETQPPAAPKVILQHHALAMGAAHERALLTLPQWPAAMAAWADHLWVAMPARLEGGAGETRQRLFHAEVARHAFNQRYYLKSRDRLDEAPPLPAGSLQTLVATADGPWALLRNRIATNDEGDTTRLQLVRLVDERQWIEAPLPPDLPPDSTPWVIAVGDRGASIWLLSAKVASLDTGTWLDRLVNRGGWHRSLIPVDARAFRQVVRVDGRPALVMDGPGKGELSLAYVRPHGIVELARFQQPRPPWWLLGAGDGARLVTQAPDSGRDDGASGQRRIMKVDAITGAWHDLGTIRPQPLAAWRMLHIPVLMVAAVTLLLLAFLFRMDASRVVLPDLSGPLNAWPRLLAFAIDFLPGALGAVLLLRCEPGALLRLPTVVISIEESFPFLAALGITMLHSAAGELLAGGTLGKMLVGARVATTGKAPVWLAIVLRNVLKAVILLLPPLAVFTLLNPRGQSLADQLARTVVVRDVERRGDPSKGGDATAAHR
jgi:uncharacterized RDD family membrane protein YckC